MQVTRSSHLNPQETTRAHFESGAPSYTGNSLRSMQEKSNEKRSSCSVFWGKVREGLAFLWRLLCCGFCCCRPKVWTKTELLSCIKNSLLKPLERRIYCRFFPEGLYGGLILCKIGDKELRKQIPDIRTYSLGEDIEKWVSGLEEEDLRGVFKWIYIPLKDNKLPKDPILCVGNQNSYHIHCFAEGTKFIPIPIDSSEKLWEYAKA